MYKLHHLYGITNIIFSHSSILSIYNCCITGPSAPPQNVTTKVISSASISVSWDPPPIGDQNGVITNYSIIIANLNRTNSSTIVVTNTSFTAVDLEEFEAYNISVAAMTAIGLGPFSDVMRSQTLAHSKYLVCTCVFIILILCTCVCTYKYVHVHVCRCVCVWRVQQKKPSGSW